jgi:hypothetical protein
MGQTAIESEGTAMNSDKIILDLCGGTGAWSKPYRDAGYDVRVITLPDGDVCTYEPPGGVYGILAAPPCTEFSIAKNGRPRSFADGMRVVEACMKIVWNCRLEGRLKFWAMENPRGYLRQFLGIPRFTFEQWQFKTPGIKPTDVWGYFKQPTSAVKDRPDDLVVKYKDQHSHGRLLAVPHCPEEYQNMGLDRAAIRAITPSGFAKAFFTANQ